MVEEWNLDTNLMRDPYDGRLYEPPFPISPQPSGKRVRVLKLDLTLQPQRTHRLAVFYRQPAGYDTIEYRPGDRPSRQFCFLAGNAEKWREYRWVHWTIQWPQGTSRISFPRRREGKYWRAGDYHNASFSTGKQDMHIGWVR